ncbi:MAG: hypothetical protein ACREDQ_05905 [Limisphaerales bacterium]
MKSRDLFKDIFTLAIRLLGLVFLYLGLSAVTPLLDFGAIETAAKSDLITAILPIVFNLVVAWWLLGGRVLIRRAYPETPEISSPFPAPRQAAVPAATSTSPKRMADLEAADKKLAALVEKPKDDGVA